MMGDVEKQRNKNQEGRDGHVIIIDKVGTRGESSRYTIPKVLSSQYHTFDHEILWLEKGEAYRLINSGVIM